MSNRAIFTVICGAGFRELRNRAEKPLNDKGFFRDWIKFNLHASCGIGMADE